MRIITYTVQISVQVSALPTGKYSLLYIDIDTDLAVFLSSRKLHTSSRTVTMSLISGKN